MDDEPMLALIGIKRLDEGIEEDGRRWSVSFVASTMTLNAVELVVEVDANSPEDALVNGRGAILDALRNLKRIAAGWKS